MERERGGEKETCVYGRHTHQFFFFHTNMRVCGHFFPKMCVYGRECAWLIGVVYVQPQICTHSCHIFCTYTTVRQLCVQVTSYFLSQLCDNCDNSCDNCVTTVCASHITFFLTTVCDNCVTCVRDNCVSIFLYILCDNYV